MVKSTSGDKTLDQVLLDIEKQFGKGAVMKLGERDHQKIDTISSGSISLDIALGIGGYPKGARLYYTDNTGTTYIVESLINDNNNNFVANPSLIDGVNWKYVSSTPITNTLSANSASNVFSTQAIQNKFQMVNQLPQNPNADTYYFIPE